MADSTIDNVNEHYNEDSDEDFDPTAAAAAPPPDSSDDEDDTTAAASHGKRSAKQKPTPASDDDDLDFDNSGDELTIKSGKKRKRKDADHDDEDEGGEGGFVRTRAQRKAEGVERRPLADTTQAKVDVNALWAEMSKGDQSSLAPAAAKELTTERVAKTGTLDPKSADPPRPSSDAALAPGQSDMVTIKRRYDFAGQTIEEERQVPSTSAEAKLYLEEQSKAATATASAAPKPAVGRPKRRKMPFGDFNADNPASTGPAKPAKKLNTIEKSRLDWAAHVDKEGFGEELDEASRAKGSYLGKVDFIDRMNAKQDSARNFK